MPEFSDHREGGIMGDPRLTREELNPAEFDKIAALAGEKTYPAGATIFAEGDPPDYIYFIRSGRVSVSIQKFTAQEELSVLGSGQCFGEMAVLEQTRRTASVRALVDTTVLRMDEKNFLSLCETEGLFSKKIKAILARRNHELTLKENLIESTGMPGKHLHISIKGDPSLRETAFMRGKRESVVDKVLPQLVPQLTDLLLNRCVYQVLIHFNSGEIGVSSVFDPFYSEIHPANKLADPAYVERHFSKMAYDKKVQLIRRVYSSITADAAFRGLSERFQQVYFDSHKTWQPMAPEQIRTAVSRLPDLRRIPDFYLRNFMVSVIRDAIRMQFNCDGTHIVGAEDYLQFLDENLE